MALFQPFKPTTRPKSSNLTQATLQQGIMDQQAVQQANQARNAMYGGATELGVGLYGEYKDDESPIGGYLRRLTGADAGPTEENPIEMANLGAERPPETGIDFGGETAVPTEGGDDSIRALLDQFMPTDALGTAATDVGADLATDAATDAATGAATDAVVEQGSEELLNEVAGASGVPGGGTLMSIAEGDLEGAAFKQALAMAMPPPYGQILAMLL